MGQIPDKTYTAPDGSVYRVEADGSVTKIKSGRVVSNEPSSKYKITPDGKIYRVESDGTVTYLGNAEEIQNPSLAASNKGSNNSGQKWGWIILAIIVIAVVIFGIIKSNESNSNNGVTSEEIGYSDTTVVEQEVTPHAHDVTPSESPTGGSTVSQEDRVFSAGDYGGDFYGVIEGLGTIRGTWTCGSEMGGGWYCVDGQNESYGRDLDFIMDEPLVWHEKIDHGDYYEPTGTWYFDYFYGAKKKMATGTYVRNSDNRRFPFTLYKE